MCNIISMKIHLYLYVEMISEQRLDYGDNYGIINYSLFLPLDVW